MRMDYFSDLVEQEIDGSKATVSGDGSKFEAHVVSESFEGIGAVKRHQMIYAVLEDHIKSGAIHALTIKAFTPTEWSAKQPA